MMKRSVGVLVIVLTLSMMTSCLGNQEKNKTTVTPSESTNTIPPEENLNSTIQPQVDEFSLLINNTSISLHAWDNEINLEQVLGKPISQNIHELKGDGFTGSFLKKIKYNGLELELFSPKDNGKKFWIMTMVVTKRGYPTSKGIELGSTVKEIKDAYPAIKISEDGRTDPNNCAYEIRNVQEYNHMQFEVKDGKVAHIKIFHLIP
ncbi:hypothetical protein [Paenibacillus caui]|uniref:hypothetical protein n=1 Tax=Paenibacillus caui TaxID=2873927 RepID=UPI001CAA26CA|nr:hypothetical protein [Paenibacillus caui]